MRCAFTFIEDDQSQRGQTHKTMREGVKKNLRSRHNDLYVLENDIPVFLARPAINTISSFEALGLNRADLRLYVVKLLLAQRYRWCQEPDKLMF